jgi:hypothetical protein
MPLIISPSIPNRLHSNCNWAGSQSDKRVDFGAAPPVKGGGWKVVNLNASPDIDKRGEMISPFFSADKD